MQAYDIASKTWEDWSEHRLVWCFGRVCVYAVDVWPRFRYQIKPHSPPPHTHSATLVPRSVLGVAPLPGMGDGTALVLFGGEVDPSSEGHMVRFILFLCVYMYIGGLLGMVGWCIVCHAAWYGRGGGPGAVFLGAGRWTRPRRGILWVGGYIDTCLFM